MSKFSIVGFCCLVGGFFMYIFQKVSTLMERKDLMNIHSLNDIIGAAWIEKMPWPWLQNAATYIGDSPLTILLCIIGVVLIIIGSLKKNV